MTESSLSRADAERIAERVYDEHAVNGLVRWGVTINEQRARAIALVLAGAEAVRGRELTEAEVAEAWDATMQGGPVQQSGLSGQLASWDDSIFAGNNRTRLLAFARRLARPADLDAVRREAWDAARDWWLPADRDWSGRTISRAHFDTERDRRWPAPAPKVPSVVLSDGSVVRYNGEPTDVDGLHRYRWTRSWKFDRGVSSRSSDEWGFLVDGSVDRDAVKALAASVRASTGGEDSHA